MYQTRTVFVLAGLTLGTLTARPASADPFLSVPPASFLNYHVASVRELSQEVALDPLVRARLAHHFHRTEPDMTAYIRENLTLTRLSRAGTYRVACVTPSGREYAITERLAAGTPVFTSTRTGRPILKLACGNPLVASLPPAPPRPKPVVKVKRSPAVLAPTAKTLLPEVPALTDDSLETFAFTAPTPLVGLAPAAIGPLTQVGGVQQALISKGGGIGFLPIVAAGGIAALLPKGGGSSPAPEKPIIPIAPPVPTPAVPEASPLLLLSLGGAALLGWSRRTRKI